MLAAFGHKAQLHLGDTAVILGEGTVLYASAYLPMQYGLLMGGEVDLRRLITQVVPLGEMPEEVGRTRSGRVLVVYRAPMPSRSTSTSEVPGLTRERLTKSSPPWRRSGLERCARSRWRRRSSASTEWVRVLTCGRQMESPGQSLEESMPTTHVNGWETRRSTC